LHSWRAPEAELLRLCARAALAPGDAERLRYLACGGLDWSAIQRLGQRHRLTPLLHRHLGTHAAALMPAAAGETLSHAARSLAGINLGLAWELLRLLKLLGEHGIEAVPFKGPVLAQQLYGDPALRCIGDLDLLLRQQDVLRAGELLCTEGFRFEAKLEPRMVPILFAEECELNLDHDRSGLHVELHWDFLPRYYGFRLLATDPWQRLERQRLGGQEVPSLGDNDLLLMLCAHGAKHAWSDLSLIADVAELIRSASIRWGELFECARRLGCERILLLGVRLAATVLDAPVPPEVNAAAGRDASLPGLLRYVDRRLGSSDSVPAGWDSLTARVFQVRLQETARDRLRFTAGFSRLAVLHKLGHFVPPRDRSPATDAGTPDATHA
jgi:hypothetical protein